jgi:hypothetical protein
LALTLQIGDFVCIALGCIFPVLLRPTLENNFEVIGDFFVHGIVEAESLLGPIPLPWRSFSFNNESGFGEPWYHIFDKRELDVILHHSPDSRGIIKAKYPSREDPRLGSLPPNWERVDDYKKKSDNPILLAVFRNTETGEIMKSDPRMLPEALVACGVKLQQFRFV